MPRDLRTVMPDMPRALGALMPEVPCAVLTLVLDVLLPYVVSCLMCSSASRAS